MLNAIVNGKAGRTKEDIKAGTSWRAAFHGREDLLTASVFERLSYLPGPIFWEILEKSFKLSVNIGSLGFPSDIRLGQFEFWPRFNVTKQDKISTSGASYREPDLFFQFHCQSLSRRIDIILEAKPYDSIGQDAGQWDEQCAAYIENYSSKAQHVLYLAIGGLGQRSERLNHLRTQLETKYRNIKFYGTSWTKLTHIIKNMRDGDIDIHVKFLLNDVLQALNLAGYREIVPLQSLVSARPFNRHYVQKMYSLRNI